MVEQDLDELLSFVGQYQDDIQELETKLRSAREKQRLLVQRHIRAQRKKKAHEEIRRMDSAQVMQKFDEMESNIERMEAEADLVNYGKKSAWKRRLKNCPPTMISNVSSDIKILPNPTQR